MIYHFNHLTAENGLSSGQFNYYIHQDLHGFVWISSIMGLNCYDGKKIRQYHSGSSPHELRSEFAAQSRFQENAEGELWFTNNESLTHYIREQDHFEHFQFTVPGKKDTLQTLYFWSYLDTLTNYIWVSGGQHLFALNTRNTNDRKYIDSLYVRIKDRMYALPGNQQYLLMCGYGNPSLRIREFRDFRPYADTTFASPNQTAVNDIRFQSPDTIWVATDLGLYHFNMLTGQWRRPATYYKNQSINEVTEISFINKHELLVATKNQGIYYFNIDQEQFTGQIFAFDNNRIGPFKPAVVRMVIDREDNLWIHVKDDGIYYTHLRKPKFNTSLFGRDRMSAKAIHVNTDHSLWILDQTRAIKVSPKDTLIYPLPISGVDLEQAICIFEDRQKRVWVGTLWDLYVLHPGQKAFKKINLLPESLRKDERMPGYNDIYQLPSGDLLLGTNAKYVVRVSEDLQQSSLLQQLTRRPRHFFAGPEQALLIATYEDSLHIGHLTGRVNFQIDSTFTQIPFVSSACYDSLRQLYWVGTYNGLHRLQQQHDGKWQWSSEAAAGTNLSVNSLALDQKYRLWMTFPGGIRCYDPDYRSYKTYHRADGLQGLDYIMTASAVKNDGEILFGGTNGLSRFYPEQVQPSAPPSRPIVTAISINQEPNLAFTYSTESTRNPSLIKQLRLPFHKNNLGFTLASLEYSAPDQCIFSYQLLGSTDTSVVIHGASPQLNFPNLSPGTFVLKIWSTNSDGIRSSHPHQIDIEILPPWYRTIWFYSLCLLATLFAGFAAYRIRLKRIIRQEHLKRIASEARRQLAETETAILRLQMDPHFIFNSMNAIDALVLEQKTEKAHEYLVCFAGLMRGILDNSTNPYTCLEDEVNLLQQYLSSEQIRMGNRLQYDIVIASNVDTFDLEIPTMILQPFVENAIWHGIAPKSGPGQITIRFRVQDEHLICEVQDDGVGRTFHQSRSTAHTAKATSITNTRLELLNAQQEIEKASFEIVDLYHSTGESNGTIVRFSFPI